ncbi:hypothetical protein HPP92_029037 [Vanilla planifolia]|uniref:Uncharacterized protein n=1 Tax=Vanilla planifolia TaxID=51239 RepID=A0A835U2L4_VANPL|nr:hypothetical protein HPP92_029037 [Vanilla planifolia]KAG0446054.1 hypothetical protein HPP92_029025 [Vanilla planifolia]
MICDQENDALPSWDCPQPRMVWINFRPVQTTRGMCLLAHRARTLSLVEEGQREFPTDVTEKTVWPDISMILPTGPVRRVKGRWKEQGRAGTVMMPCRDQSRTAVLADLGTGVEAVGGKDAA